MPGYTTRPKRGNRTSKQRHCASSPGQRCQAPANPEFMEQDPLCAYMLHMARESSVPEIADNFHEQALRIWRERHPSPSCDPSPLRVGAFVLCSTEKTPESEFGEEDSPSEEEEDYPPSEHSASTVDYGGREEEEDYPPSEDSASTVDYGGREEEEDYPPSEDSASTVDYGWREEEEEEYPPSVCSGGSWRTDDGSYMEEEEEEMETEGDHSHGPFGQSVSRNAPGAYASPRAAPGTSARRAAPGTSARRAAPGGESAAKAGGAPPTAAPAAPAAPDLSPLLALLLARSLAPMSCVCVPVFVSLPLCVPNPFFPLVPLCVSVPVCVFVNVPFNVSSVFSPVFPGRVF